MPLGAGEPLDPVPVGTDRDDGGAVGRIGGGVEHGLQIGAGTGHEHDKPNGHHETVSTGSALLSAGLPDITG
ncbi:hypothetical protein GCM10007977_018270 [Dactylosporangium sucinum]|uniref:Uncharacterized protein n=1 Tax=Dactylosporangium sucinum TaxID=1424081 RepID=A0A917TCK7_9ACTN|nr:hypothetical protein GCM10007977_018270 [Dactylosporangium sucinum]